jgi:hypothetical protein
MKKDKKNNNGAPATPKPRTVKIADKIHHDIRVLSVKMRIPMQSFIEQLLLVGLKEKAYEKFEAAA